jgi:hypothetical protein
MDTMVIYTIRGEHRYSVTVPKANPSEAEVVALVTAAAASKLALIGKVLKA